MKSQFSFNESVEIELIQHLTVNDLRDSFLSPNISKTVRIKDYEFDVNIGKFVIECDKELKNIIEVCKSKNMIVYLDDNNEEQIVEQDFKLHFLNNAGAIILSL